MEYWVSPLCHFTMAGPINMENSLTCTPESLAAIKWPSSWMKIRKLKIRIAIIIAKITLIRVLAQKSFCITHSLSGQAVSVQDLLQGGRLDKGDGIHGVLYQLIDVVEADLVI